ncbi:MAG: hypothetical protein WAL25_14750 [Acidimicrobiia bacterium]
MSSIRRLRWPVALASALVLALAVLPLMLAFTSGKADLGPDFASTIGTIGLLMVGPLYAVTAALIIARQPGNTIAWVMMLVALGMAVSITADVLTPTTPPVDPGLGLTLLMGLGAASWVFFMIPMFHLLLTFPTGRVLSRRWRPLIWLESALLIVMVSLGVFGQEVMPSDESWSIANPIGFIPDPGELFWSLWNVWLIILTVGGLVAMVLRFRRSRGIERQQLKVFLFGVVVFAVVYAGAVASSSSDDSTLADVLLPLAILGIGLSIAVALLRYRLYDIDRVVSRTVTYALVATVLAGAVALVAAIVGTRFADPLVVAATTLGVAALFNPIRRRVQRLVDRRFNRSHYDHERVMAEFTSTLRDLVDPDAVVQGWVNAVSDTMEPASSGVWVREA